MFINLIPFIYDNMFIILLPKFHFDDKSSFLKVVVNTGPSKMTRFLPPVLLFTFYEILNKLSKSGRVVKSKSKYLPCQMSE